MKYFAILTNQGAAKLANATALGTQLKLTHMATGDGNGSLPTPDPAQTKLVNQKRIAPLNMLFVDPGDANQIIAEQVIPENEGGFWIREIGLYDADGTLIAVANCPETYKPLLLEGSARTQTLRMALVVSATSAVSLKIDPSVVLATRKYVDDRALEVQVYTDEVMKKHLAADNPHAQYASVKAMAAELEKKLEANPAIYGKPSIVSYVPKTPSFGVDNSADLVLTFRNVHNWRMAGNAEAMFAGFYKVLKPGGVLGVVEHRAKADVPADDKSGYVGQAQVIAMAEAAGFTLAGKSELNANPRDTKDYPGGVWTLPPSNKHEATDDAKYKAIGESDRMTLKFVKR